VLGFDAITAVVARWEAWKGPDFGLEHLDLRLQSDGMLATGLVIGSSDSVHFALRYRLLIDARWCVREALIETSAGSRVELQSDGGGHWRQDGRANPSLDGCVDIDIEATPFTNTLPIRRLALPARESREIRLAYVRIPSLEVVPAAQRYTAIDPPRLYRFDSLEHSFTADLPVDRYGLVKDYPGLFRRVL
jgi:hypothetical protein